MKPEIILLLSRFKIHKDASTLEAQLQIQTSSVQVAARKRTYFCTPHLTLASDRHTSPFLLFDKDSGPGKNVTVFQSTQTAAKLWPGWDYIFSSCDTEEKALSSADGSTNTECLGTKSILVRPKLLVQLSSACFCEVLSCTDKKDEWELLIVEVERFQTGYLVFHFPFRISRGSSSYTVAYKSINNTLLWKDVSGDGVLGPPFTSREISARFVSWRQMSTDQRACQLMSFEGEVFAGVVFCSNLETMAFHWHLPWVPLLSTVFTHLLLPHQEASVFFACILGRCTSSRCLI